MKGRDPSVEARRRALAFIEDGGSIPGSFDLPEFRAKILAARASDAAAYVSRGPRKARFGLFRVAVAAVLVAALSSAITLALVGSYDSVEVRFVLAAPNARSVVLAGDFNGWSTESHRLRLNPGTGKWEIAIVLKKGQSYAYNFVIDGESWVPDPEAPVSLDDGFGGESSSLSL